MTPLAHRILKELTLPIRKRMLQDHARLLPNMGEVHCFEMSEVFNLAGDAGRALHDAGVKDGKVPGCLAFLPAPKTWLEWKKTDGSREGVLLYQEVGSDCICQWAFGWGDHLISAPRKGQLSLNGGNMSMISPRMAARDLDGEPEAAKIGWIFWLYGALALINTPRIIGRIQHMPHRGLEKRLIAQRGMIGKFPLHAWTEIQLQVTPPKDLTSEGVHEAHLTGQRALHFCRSHLRIRNGCLEQVKAHWRGDPALGIKRSRYKLVA